MTDWIGTISRRRFLSTLAIAGATPIWSRFDGLAWEQASPAFSGENVELAHTLLFDPDATIKGGGAPESHPELHDVLIVGGGIAGLTAAWTLRGRRVCLLEAADQVGGVSRSEAWQGIEYAIGAAYIIDPDPESEDARELAGFALLEELGLRRKGEDLSRPGRDRRHSGDANHCVFTNRRVVPHGEVYSRQNRRFFEHVLDSDDYPSVPPGDPALVEALDRVSFRAFLEDAALQRRLYGQSVGAISSTGWEAIEYYCWGAFGTIARETSAYHGLNFFAAEFGDVLVYPGGNGYITRRLGERIRTQSPRVIRTGAWTLRVEKDADGFVATTWEGGRLHRHRARTAIFAAPLFLAPKIVPSLGEAQRAAIASLQYRSYVVANVLLGRPADRIFADPAFRNGYELTRVHGIDAATMDAEHVSDGKVYSDAILADFASARHPTHAVLTVYRPYPYDGGRAKLLGLSYEHVESEIRREVMAGFQAHGLRGADIQGVRIARWGHPMIVTRPGQLADGTLRTAAAPHDGLFFAHTDVHGAPAYENALAAAFDAAEGVTAVLGAA